MKVGEEDYYHETVFVLLPDDSSQCFIYIIHYTAADETLTATVFEIYRDRLEVTRYDSEGMHDLGSDGAGDPYKGGIDEGLIGPEKYSRAVASPQQVMRKAAGF